MVAKVSVGLLKIPRSVTILAGKETGVIAAYVLAEHAPASLTLDRVFPVLYAQSKHLVNQIIIHTFPRANTKSA